jgi:LysM domain-containing protein
MGGIMTEYDFDVFAKMWKEQPENARGSFPVGIDYLVEAGDTLVSIAERFGIPWQRLVEGAVKRWAMDGPVSPNSFDSFTAGMEIRLSAPKEEWQNSFVPFETDQMAALWSNSPGTAAFLFPYGLSYAIGDDETLANLGEKFGIPWEAIAEATMGTSNPKEINDWLANNGGRKLPSGYWAFTPGQEIIIPAPADQAEPELGSVLADVSNVTGDDIT